MSGVVKTVGKVASSVAPFASKIPGVGSFAGGLLGAGGQLLQGNGLTAALQSGLSGFNPLGNLAQLLPTFAQGQGGYGQAGNVTTAAQPGVGPVSTDPSSFAGNIFNWLKSPQNLALLGLGGLGAYGLNKSGMISPQVINDPRNAPVDAFSQILQKALGGQTGQILSTGQLPQYQGPYAATTNPAQTSAMGGLQDVINSITGSTQGQDILGTLTGMANSGNQLNLPPEIQALLGGGNAGNNILQGIGQGTSLPAQLLQQLGLQDPTQQAQGVIGQGSDLLQSLASSPELQQLLSGGQGADINQIGQMLSNASMPGLMDNIANLREQFSFNGLRNSTDLNQGVSNLMARNQSGLQGQLASIIPQLTSNANQTALGAGGLLSQIGSTFGNLGSAAGNLGLGAGGLQSQALQSLLNSQTSAGTALQSGGNQQLDILSQLFGGQQQRALGAATALPGAYTGIEGLLPSIYGQQFSQGQTLTGNAQQGIQNMLSQFNQGNSLYPLLLQYLGGTPQQQVGPSLLSQLGSLVTQGAVAKQLK